MTSIDLGPLTDANLAASGHLDSLVGDHEVRSFVIDPPGEVSKHIGTVQQVITAMEKDALGRDTVLLALGGGTVGDLGGFAAAIFKRGIPYVQIPTTTVAQADSAVGGKVGVDSELSKNAYGAFKQPSRVYADVLTLTSLADRHFRAGLVESVKHALIADADYFEFFEANLDRMLAREFGVLTEIAEKNVRIKGSVVEQDPQESGRRKILNYGHTIGHAVESASGFALLHGEAVAIGILAAGRIAEELGLLSPEVHGRVVRIWQALGMRICTMSPAEHDRVLARISHLPHILAMALVNCSDPRQMLLCGKGFLDTTRIASGAPGVWRDILTANAGHTAAAIGKLIKELARVQQNLEQGKDQAILKMLTKAQVRRDELVEQKLIRKELST